MSAPSGLVVEPMGASLGHCDCCGRDSRIIWGWVHAAEGTVGAYLVQWTEGHLADKGANIDFILGRWGEGSSARDRIAVSLVHRQDAEAGATLTVVDARDRGVAAGELAGSALARDQVIGTPLASQVFALIDAIYVQDGRFF